MKKAIWKKCNGDAHSNPHIDHCGVCMPYWGDYPVCPECGRKITKGGVKRAKCRNCGIMVDMTNDPLLTPTPPKETVMVRDTRIPKDTRPIVESKLSHGDKVELHAAIRDLQMACARIGAALEANNKFTEFETLKEAYMAVKRVDPTLANIMFNFVRGSK